MEGVDPGKEVVAGIKKKSGQAMRSKPVGSSLSGPRFQFLLSGSCLEFLSCFSLEWTVICNHRSVIFSPTLVFVSVFLQ